MIAPEAPAIDYALEQRIRDAERNHCAAQTLGESLAWKRLVDSRSERFQCPPLLVGEDESGTSRCACRSGLPTSEVA